MSIIRDVEEGLKITFSHKCYNGYRNRDVVESGPVVETETTEDSSANPYTLTAKYWGNNPVTITWKVDGRVLYQVEDRVRQSETSLVIYDKWFSVSGYYKFTVTVYDQVLGERFAVNPMSTSINIAVTFTK